MIFRAGSSVSDLESDFDIDPPTDHEEYAKHAFASLGRAFSAWTDVEALACRLFAAITRIPNPLVSGLFFSARSFNGSLDLIRAALRCSIMQEKNQEPATEAVRFLTSYYQTRNLLAHSMIGLFGDSKKIMAGGSLHDAEMHVRSYTNIETIIFDENDLSEIRRNYVRLSIYIAILCEEIEGTTKEEFSTARSLNIPDSLSELRALPIHPQSTRLSPKQAGREKQRQAALRSKAAKEHKQP